jgi:hypothetical protein
MWAVPFAALSGLRQIGVGSFGTVFQAQLNGVAVAVKSAGDAAHASLLEREVHLGSHVPPHPHVVQVLGFVCDAPDATLRLVMELCLSSLKDFMQAAHSVVRVRTFTCCRPCWTNAAV